MPSHTMSIPQKLSLHRLLPSFCGVMSGQGLLRSIVFIDLTAGPVGILIQEFPVLFA